MSKRLRVSNETAALLEELKHILRKRSVEATLREILGDLYDDEDEDQMDLDDFDEEDDDYGY